MGGKTYSTLFFVCAWIHAQLFVQSVYLQQTEVERGWGEVIYYICPSENGVNFVVLVFQYKLSLHNTFASQNNTTPCSLCPYDIKPSL